MSSIILAGHTKDNELDTRVQGKAHIPNIYNKLANPFPCARAFNTLVCSVSNKGRLQILDRLHQHCLRANYLACLMHRPFPKHHLSPLGHGWELVGGPCRPVRHSRPALLTHLPAPGPAEESGEDDSEDDDEGDENIQTTKPRIHLNLIIQNLVRQNALIRTDSISQC